VLLLASGSAGAPQRAPVITLIPLDQVQEVSHYTFPAGCEPRQGEIELACEDAATGLHYWLYLPDPVRVPAGQKPPLLVYLHGFNQSGADLDLLLNGGPPLQIENKRTLPMVVVSPQCPSRDNWQNADMVERLSLLVSESVKQYGADPLRVYLTGFSMGGDGVWALGIAHPEQFAALAPVGSWYVNDEKVCDLKDVPVWDFQGNMDQIVDPQYAKRMVADLQRCGGNVKLTLFQGANHEGSSGMTYGMDEFYTWLMDQE
jgi:predicted peptidase